MEGLAVVLLNVAYQIEGGMEGDVMNRVSFLQ